MKHVPIEPVSRLAETAPTKFFIISVNASASSLFFRAAIEIFWVVANDY